MDKDLTSFESSEYKTFFRKYKEIKIKINNEVSLHLHAERSVQYFKLHNWRNRSGNGKCLRAEYVFWGDS